MTNTETSLEFLADRLSYEAEHTYHPGFWEGARAGHGFACHRASLGQLVTLENLDLPALLEMAELDPLAAAGDLANLMGKPRQTPEGLFGHRADGDPLKAGHILGFVLAARADWAAVRHEVIAPHRLEPGFLPHH